MKIAVVGAGFAGLAAAYFLSEKHKVVLFDKKGIGAGASGVSTGLLHPYPGEQGRLSWHADTAMVAARALLQVAAKEMGLPVANDNGIIKLGACIGARDDVQLINPGEFLIRSGITVFVPLYLEGLWRACERRGVELCIKEVKRSLPFDRTILAIGSEVGKFCTLPLGFVKGQRLTCRLDQPLERSIASKRSIVMTENPNLCHIGSTYERNFTSEEPSLETARQLLQPKTEVLECRSAIRVTNPAHYFPILKQIDATTWVITALGSRGLLYHAYLGQMIASKRDLCYF